MKKGFTYNEFEKALNDVELVWNLNQNISDRIREYNSDAKDCCEILLPSMDTDVISLLEFIMDDTSGWISYWALELDFGNEYKDGSITEADGTIIPLKTKKDLWNVLTHDPKL